MENLVQITTNQFLSGITSIVVLNFLVQWFLANWIQIRLEKSIQHEYDKRLEDYKFSQLQRQKASLIANFFSKWIKYRGLEKELLTKEELILYYEDLNRMSIEISLWIKDGILLNEIMSLLALKEEAPDIRSLTGKVRKLILGIDGDDFDPQNIIIWPKIEIAECLFKTDNKE